MKYVIAVREIMDRGLWLEFCELRGINEWAVNEGMIDSDQEYTLTADEAVKLGLVPKARERRDW